MKVVFAFDSFKGSLDAASACEAAAGALREALPDAEAVIHPMADGGEGTAEVVRRAVGGSWVRRRVCGPLPGTRVDAGFATILGGRCAVVEMASASGLTLVPPASRNPLRTTTYGTGQLLGAAAELGAEEIWLAVGGSATVDGGTGAASALGWRFLAADGREAGLGGAALGRVVRAVAPARRDWPPIRVLCDVTNPLCGPRGAARVFAPQKGADPAMVEELERGLERLAAIARRDAGADVRELPGGGAAGGLAAGAAAFLGAELRSGSRAVVELTGLDARLDGADWVVTGEGKFDRQSLDGKAVSGVAEAARRAGVPVLVIAGAVELAPEDYLPLGIRSARSLLEEGGDVEQAMAQAGARLARCVQAWAKSVNRSLR